jgi:hypothetical protein
MEVYESNDIGKEKLLPGGAKPSCVINHPRLGSALIEGHDGARRRKDELDS